MELINLAQRGVKRIVKPPIADLETCKVYRPGDVGRLVAVTDAYGLSTTAVFIKDITPDWLESAYRDAPGDPGVKVSAHYFACAYDVTVGGILKQICFAKLAIIDMKLFNRGGLYVGKSCCHVDTCDVKWMRRYNGAKYWVWHRGKYQSFNCFETAADYALNAAKNGG